MKRPTVGDEVQIPRAFGYQVATVVDVFGGDDGYVTVEVPIHDAWGKTADTVLETLPISQLSSVNEATAHQ